MWQKLQKKWEYNGRIKSEVDPLYAMKDAWGERRYSPSLS
jgi:hypothetical protein